MPCRGAWPHLRELQQELGPKGLIVLGLSYETEDLVAKYVEEMGLDDLRIGSGSDANVRFDVNAIPHAVLIDPEGEIAWRGNPRELGRKTVEEALRGARPVTEHDYLTVLLDDEPHARLSGAAKAAAQGQLGKALSAARKVAAGEGELALAGERIAAAVEERVALLRSQAEGLIERRDVVRAVEVLEALSDALKGDELGKQAEKRLAEVRADEALAPELEAAEALDRALELADRRGIKKAASKLEALIEKYPGTKAAARARQLLR